MSIEIQRYRPINKGVVKCGFSVKLISWGLTINDCCLMEKGNQSWVSFPSRKYEANGQTKYAPYVFFEKEVLEKLSDAIKTELAKIENSPPPSHEAQYGQGSSNQGNNMDDIPF